jgi:hypothetical protein
MNRSTRLSKNTRREILLISRENLNPFLQLTLTLFVPWIGTNHPNRTVSADDPAVPTNLFD